MGSEMCIRDRADIDRNVLFAISPDQRFVFYVDGSRATKRVFRASIDNSSPLLNIIGERNNLRIKRFQSLDIINNQLFFIGFSLQNGTPLVVQLYSSSLDGSVTTQISPFSINGALLETVDFQISDNGQFAVYVTDNLENDNTDLFSVNLSPTETCFPIKTQNGNFVTICL